MADPTLRLTYTQLRIRVAEYLGVADYSGGTAGLPTDPHDLDMVGRLVNDGYRRFLSDHPRWNFLTVPLTLTFGTGTVGGDASRYYLPDDFGGKLLAPFTYGTGGPSLEVRQVPEATIRRYRQGDGSGTGQPAAFAVRPINTTNAATGQRWEAVFWPTPAGTQTVTALYRRSPNALSAAGDTSVAGHEHDTAVLGACIAAAELEKNDTIGVREQR